MLPHSGSRKRGKAKACERFPTIQVVIGCLALANVLVFLGTLSYLWQLWQPQGNGELKEPKELDFSHLYDAPPGHANEETTADTTADPARAQVQASLVTHHEAPEPPRSEAEPPRCPICGHEIRGPLPTTFKARASCTWQEFPSTFLSDMVGGGQMRLQDAKDLCVEFGPACSGVTCAAKDSQAPSCTARAQKEPRSSPSKEVSFLKSCRYDSGSNCEEGADIPPGLAKDLRGTAIVILAHNREQELRTCLNSLLAMPEAALFRIHVSLDDPTAFVMMEGCVKRVAAAHRSDISIWRAKEQVANPQIHGQEMQKWFAMNAGKIAHHYWQVFERAFMVESFDQVIFAEEDLVFSPDFLAFFRSTSWLLEQDASLWCISAWNDFGFKGTAEDPCRLHRTTYFPGLGFLLTRQAWLQIREEWPTAPTMGWDYWMRVAFRTFDKECIVPEVSRTHHAAAKGSSVSSAKQLRLFEAMAFADVASSCDVTKPCNHFGNVTYLIDKEYESWMRSAISNAPRTSPEELKQPRAMPKVLHVLPIQRERYNAIAEEAGLLPRNTKGSIPADLRSEHYGVMTGKSLKQRVPLLLVDKRSSRGYLRPEEQLRFGEDFEVIAGTRGWSCDEVCKHRGTTCDAMQLYFLNDCNLLRKHFACEAGCAHQVGKELPVYVPDDFQPTYRQCLLTFISPMSCTAKHASTSRLCACRKLPGT